MTDLNLLAGIGERIRILRVRRKMQQNELALQCGFDKASMSRIESGKTNITIQTLGRIAAALNVDIVELFSQEPVER